VILGSIRNSEDEALVKTLMKFAEELGIIENVNFQV
jgi:hypothetical protein